MAENNPAVKIISLDISKGACKTRELTCGLGNVWVIRGSALNIPVSDNTLDFAYSFGVLHHTTDPERGIKEIARIIKKDSPAYLYIYEDHSENRIKYLALKLVKALRLITTKIPPRALFILSFSASPFIMIFFTFPHRFFRRFKTTQVLAENIPFNFGSNLFSLTGDLYDRFGAPIEHRFSRQEIFNLLKRNGFVNISIGRMKSTAGWVVWGHKG
jgi:SAM-dependent methyltransferase